MKAGMVQGHEIWVARRAARISQEVLARELGLAQVTIRDAEAGRIVHGLGAEEVERWLAAIERLAANREEKRR